MGLPNIIINFKSSATTAIKRGARGIVAIILKDATLRGFQSLESENDIPSTLSDENKAYVKRAFIGGVNKPNKVVIFAVADDAQNFTEAFSYLETVKFDYVVGGPTLTTQEGTAISTWVKKMRDELDKKVKAVLPGVVADHEGIINFTTTGIKVGEETLTNIKFCSRIAGLIAGTPLNMSCTFAVLPEVDDVPRMTTAELSDEIDAGKFVLFNDGENVKVGRGVNSLTTVSAAKGVSFKKIKVVDIMDLIHYDIKKTVNDNFIGKFPNDYDNKCILITAIQEYYETLEADGLLEKGKSSIDIDIAAQTEYLKSIGKDTAAMNEYEIKSANTGDKVFLTSSISPLDAIEEITMNVSV